MKNALFAAIVASFVMSSVSFADNMNKSETTTTTTTSSTAPAANDVNPDHSAMKSKKMTKKSKKMTKTTKSEEKTN